MELVSVIIPTFNREKSIRKSIISVLNQTYSNLECIVIDDCSNDQTEQIVKAITDDRLQYVKNDFNRGAAIARNVGIKKAKGQYIAFNDSDDVWLEDKLEKQMQYLSENPDYGMCYCRYRLHKKEKTVCIPDLLPLTEMEGDIFSTLLKGNLIGTPTMLIKKEILSVTGIFNEELKAIEDYDLALRIAKKYKIGYLNEVLVDAYETVGGVSSDPKKEVDALIKMFDYFSCEEEKEEFCCAPFLINGICSLKEIVDLNHCFGSFYSRGVSKESLFEMLKKNIYFRKNSESKLYLLKNIADNRKLNVMLREYGLSRYVMIYGNGEVGQALSDILKNTGYIVLGIIDRRDITYRGFPSFHVYSLPDEEFDILNSLPEEKCNSNELQEKVKHRVLSLEKMCKDFEHGMYE